MSPRLAWAAITLVAIALVWWFNPFSFRGSDGASETMFLRNADPLYDSPRVIQGNAFAGRDGATQATAPRLRRDDLMEQALAQVWKLKRFDNVYVFRWENDFAQIQVNALADNSRSPLDFDASIGPNQFQNATSDQVSGVFAIAIKRRDRTSVWEVHFVRVAECDYGTRRESKISERTGIVLLDENVDQRSLNPFSVFTQHISGRRIEIAHANRDEAPVLKIQLGLPAP